MYVLGSVDPVVLDKSPDALIALAHNTNGKHVAVSEHPTYNKYFKMVKEGVAVEVVKSKMEMDGIDSSIIDKPPDVKVKANKGAAIVNFNTFYYHRFRLKPRLLRRRRRKKKIRLSL